MQLRARAFWLAMSITAMSATVMADPSVAPLSGYRLDNYNAPVPDSLPGGQTMHTGELYTFASMTQVVLIDVLPAQRRPPAMQPGMPWMPTAHHNLAGSIWLPEIGRGVVSPDMDAWFERELQKSTAGNRAMPVVFYCRADCWMSWNAARRAIEHGWTRVIWYPDGPEVWAAAGLPLMEAHPIAME